MTDEMHPQVAVVLAQTQRLQSVLDEQLHKMATQRFTATDETETVEVTLNGHHWLVELFIEDGLLRLGAETVAHRLNEALHRAAGEAARSLAADRQRIDEQIGEITEKLTEAGGG